MDHARSPVAVLTFLTRRGRGGLQERGIELGQGEELYQGSGVSISIDRTTPVRLRVAGEIDLANVAHFLEHITTHAPGSRPWVLDLSGVTYADTTAIRALLSLQERFGQAFSLIANAQLIRIIEITGLKNVFHWTESR